MWLLPKVGLPLASDTSVRQPPCPVPAPSLWSAACFGRNNRVAASMITFFRRIMTSWVMIGLLALIAVAFVITGVSDPFGGGGVAPGAIAKVGNKTITEPEFLGQFDRFMKRARAENPAATNAAAVKEGAIEALVGQLEGRAAIEEFAVQQGLAISNQAVDGEIASIPAFQVNGKFDQASYQRALQSQQISEKTLREEVRGAKLTQQLLAPVSIPSNAPRLLATPYANLLLEARRGSIAIIPSAKYAAGLAPTEAQLTAYYRATINRYTIPERRSLRYAIISKQAIAAATVISDADVATYYGEHPDLYAGIAQRTLSQVVAQDQATATAIAKRAKAGEPFAKLAAELAGYGAADLAVGTVTQEKFAAATSTTVATAAFALPSGGVTAAIKSDFGWHVVRVDAVVPTKSRPLASVRTEISALLRAEKADDTLASQVADIEDALAQGQSIADVAKSHKLTIQTTPPMTKDGRVQDPSFKLANDLTPLIAKVFAAESGDEPTVEQLGPDRLAVLTAGEIVAPSPIPLAAIKAAVSADWVRVQAVAKAKMAADAIVADVKAGKPLAAALAARGLSAAQSVGGRRIDLSRSRQQIPPPIALMFTLPSGTTRAMAAPDNAGWFVVRVDEVTPGNAEADLNTLGGMESQITRGVPDELAAQFVRALQQTVGVERNAKTIAAVKKRFNSSGDAETP